MLVPVTVTTWLFAILDGGVYNPFAEIIPIGGLIDHFTDLFWVPVSVAVN
jgi:hypothetical protein